MKILIVTDAGPYLREDFLSVNAFKKILVQSGTPIIYNLIIFAGDISFTAFP